MNVALYVYRCRDYIFVDRTPFAPLEYCGSIDQLNSRVRSETVNQSKCYNYINRVTSLKELQGLHHFEREAII